MTEFDPQRLRAQRIARGLTAEQTAHRAGRSIASYYKYETGHMSPSLTSLCRLAEVLECSVEAFFDPQRPATRHWLTEAERDQIRQQVRQMAPLSDEDIEHIAAVIREARRERLEATA